MRKRVAFALFAALTGIGGAAFAAEPVYTPVRGTITAVSGSTLSITEPSGGKLTVKLAPNAAVIDIIPALLSDVKPGSYIGSAAVQQPNGVYRALELQLFPASMRGIGLGTRAWNLAPHSTMTNGTVGGLTQTGGTVGTVSGSGDLTLAVNDGSGTKKVLVPSSVSVVTYAPGTRAELRPGAHVLFFAAQPLGGTLSIARISVGKNGLVPPM